MIIMNSDAANRSGIIRYQDNGTNIGRIEYVHNGDRLAFQAGSATGETLSVINGAVGIGTTSPQRLLHLDGSVEEVLRIGNIGNTAAIHFFEGSTRRGILGYSNGSGIATAADAGDMVLRVEGSNKLHLGVGGDVALTVDDSDRVGIGTTSPKALLHLAGTGLQGVQAWFGNGFIDHANYHYSFARVGFSVEATDGSDTGAGFHFNTRNTANSNWLHGYIYQPQNGGIAFGTGGAGTTLATEKMRIDSSGNLGIGTDSPLGRLHLYKNDHTLIRIVAGDNSIA